MTFMYSWCLKCIEGTKLIGIKSIFFDEQVLQLFFPFATLKGCNPKGHPPESCRVPLHLSLPQLGLVSSRGQLFSSALPLALPRTCILLQWGLQSRGTTGSLIIYNFYEVLKLNGEHSGLNILSRVCLYFLLRLLFHNQNWLTEEIENWFISRPLEKLLLCRHPQNAVKLNIVKFYTFSKGSFSWFFPSR